MGDALSRSQTLNGKVVTLEGQVITGVGIAGIGGYRLRDPRSAAEVFVVSEDAIPSTGEVIEVRGIFRQAIAGGTYHYGVLLPNSWCNLDHATAEPTALRWLFCRA